MKILVTGAAGFIGFHTVNKFIEEGHIVVGLDNINDYYSPKLKFSRLNEAGIIEENIDWSKLVVSKKNANYQFIRLNIEDKEQLFKLFENQKFDIVINLAAQAGVRYSIENPDVYIQSNIVGFHNILEACRNYPITHLIQASSSSIYGENEKIPFSESDKTDSPVSLYAATKKSNELMAHSYSHLYKINITCLRFFTVYGPWGRPDMAPMLFVKAILDGKPINIFNNGEMSRDFTFVKDIVNGIYLSSLKADRRFNVLNIGNGSPVNLMNFIEVLEDEIGQKALKNFMPMQPGDVKVTWADIDKLTSIYGYKPKVKIEEGIDEFIKWVKAYPELI
jgi:UDP-glucuronate 4-epimerase